MRPASHSLFLSGACGGQQQAAPVGAPCPCPATPPGVVATGKGPALSPRRPRLPLRLLPVTYPLRPLACAQAALLPVVALVGPAADTHSFALQAGPQRTAVLGASLRPGPGPQIQVAEQDPPGAQLLRHGLLSLQGCARACRWGQVSRGPHHARRPHVLSLPPGLHASGSACLLEVMDEAGEKPWQV